MSSDENPRWANYCRLNGRTSEEQLEADRQAWPGGPMIGFTQWNNRLIGRFADRHPHHLIRSGTGMVLSEEGYRDYDDWLTERVTQERAMRQDRMTQDAKRIRDTARWPLGQQLPVKQQPWIVEAAGGRVTFGRILDYNLTTVRLEDGASIGFDSIEELVKVWSVD